LGRYEWEAKPTLAHAVLVRRHVRMTVWRDRADGEFGAHELGRRVMRSEKTERFLVALLLGMTTEISPYPLGVAAQGTR
jgi:hypothetical protein